MTGLIPKPFIEDLLLRVPITQIIGARIQLKKSGSGFTACCPFHQEKTPSFHVNVQKNFYHCFGCGVSGDAIHFLREYENLSFNDAVEELARSAGVEVPKDTRTQETYQQHKPLWAALEFACTKYQEALKSHPNRAVAQHYIHKRGLSAELVERFAIGFAPAERNFLSASADPERLKALINTKTVYDNHSTPFDLFQNRLMFPIRNLRGKTVAFGGRTLGEDKAKYINSPESPIFHKSNEIYGLYEASQQHRQLDRLLVVEGYIDVVSLAQFGITYAVATLGTATNAENLTQLLRHCQRLIFCFDGDNAGIKAAHKAMENALPLFQDGMQLSFLLLPQGEDPDTLIRLEGQAAFERRIEAAQPLSAFFFEVYGAGLDLAIAEHRGILKQRAESKIALVPSAVLKSALRQQLNALTFKRHTSWNEHNSQPIGKRASARHKVVTDPDTALCLALYYAPARAAEFLTRMGTINTYPRARDFADFLSAHQTQSTDDLLFLLAVDESGHREQYRHLFDALDWIPNTEEAQTAAEDVLLRLAREEKQAQALKATKMNKLPSQMTKEEKRALRSITITTSTQNPDTR